MEVSTDSIPYSFAIPTNAPFIVIFWLYQNHNCLLAEIQIHFLLHNSELVRRFKQKKKKTFWAGVVFIKSRAQWSATQHY